MRSALRTGHAYVHCIYTNPPAANRGPLGHPRPGCLQETRYQTRSIRVFVRLLGDSQAYRLADRNLVWCLALPHPANRSSGFGSRRGIDESLRRRRHRTSQGSRFKSVVFARPSTRHHPGRHGRTRRGEEARIGRLWPTATHGCRLSPPDYAGRIFRRS